MGSKGQSDGFNSQIIDHFKSAMKAVKGDPTKLIFDPFDKNPFSEAVGNPSTGVRRPQFGNPTSLDFAGGLGFSMNATNGYEVLLKKCTVSGNNYNATLSLVIFDNFGLNYGDLTIPKFLHPGVPSWYILQHFKDAYYMDAARRKIPYQYKYQPYTTIVEYEETISGTF